MNKYNYACPSEPRSASLAPQLVGAGAHTASYRAEHTARHEPPNKGESVMIFQNSGARGELLLGYVGVWDFCLPGRCQMPYFYPQTPPSMSFCPVLPPFSPVSRPEAGPGIENY